MRIYYLCLVFAFIAFSSFSTNYNGKEKNVKAKLKQKKILWVSCGILRSATVFRFEIQNKKSKLKREIIYVTITCPDGWGDDFFRKGQLYELHLSNDSSILEGFSTFDQFRLKERPEWIVKNIEKL